MIRAIFLLLCITTLNSSDRVVVLSPAINEIVYGLKKGDLIVGNTTHSTYPKESQNITKVGDYFSTSLEKILSLRPSLVLMQKNSIELKPKLEKLDINTKLIKLTSLDEIKSSIKEIGALLDSKNEADKLVDHIDKRLNTIKNIVKNRKILIVFGKYTDLKKEIFISANGVYFADLIKISGNKNAFNKTISKQPMLSYEGIVALNPDIVYILTYGIKEGDIKRVKYPWLKLPINASKSGTIYINSKKHATIPSQRIIEYIEDFKEVLEDAKSKLTPI